MAQPANRDELVTVHENGNSEQNRQREADLGTTIPAAPTRPGQAVTHRTNGGVGITTDPGVRKNGSVGVMWLGQSYATRSSAADLEVIPSADVLALIARKA